MKVVLLSTRDETAPYLDKVREAADSEKESFGFLPTGAYENFSFQSGMIVAISAHDRAMLGYVLFGGALPQGRVFQTWVAPAGRKAGVGRCLIEAVVSRLEAQSYLSVRADVAHDLAVANAFYARMGFDFVRSKPAKTKGRSINLRVRELSTPSLLDIADKQSALPCDLPGLAQAPLYLIDLNVLFDVVKQRPRALEAGRVISAALENDVRLAVSAEFPAELERTTQAGKPDPIFELAKALPRLRVPEKSQLARYLSQLAPIVFPQRNRAGTLTTQDLSDLRHLATAIEECATGFITSEKAILSAHDVLKTGFGLTVVSPESFGVEYDTAEQLRRSLSISIGGVDVEAAILREADREAAHNFVHRFCPSEGETRALLSGGTDTLPRRRYVVRSGENLVAFAAWAAPGMSNQARDLSIFVDEASVVANEACEFVLREVLADCGRSSPTMFRLQPLVGQTTLRRVALANGFYPAQKGAPRSQALQKVVIGDVVSLDGWIERVQSLEKYLGLRLPDNMPVYVGPNQPLDIKTTSGLSVELSLAEFEHLLSPAIFLLPGRSGVVLPIRAGYAEELFRGSRQPSFLSDRPAPLRSSRGYFGSAATLGVIPEGGLALFYESSKGGGRSAITAIARISRKFLLSKESAIGLSAQRGVLDENAIVRSGAGQEVAVTEFQDLMLFDAPVPLKALRVIGCVDGANFVTARPITAQHLAAVVRAGCPRA